MLVNNAGVYAFAASPDLGADAFDAMFTLNVRGAYLLTTALLPLMAGRGRGPSSTSPPPPPTGASPAPPPTGRRKRPSIC